jgi:hypothetical protein
MAQLTAGNYYTRAWRIVNLISSSVVGSVTQWTGNLLGPIGGSDPLGVDSAVIYNETGLALPINNNPPVGPLATFVNPDTGLTPLVGGPLMTDIMAQVGSSQTTQGNRG